MQNDNFGFLVFAGSLLLIICIAVRHNLFQDVNDMSKAMEIGHHNFEYQVFPDRSRPVTTMAKEIGLKQVFPRSFEGFTRYDWQEFWDIIYGSRPLIEFKNEKLPPAERSYFIDEIQKILIERYPQRFGGFGPTEWTYFWKQIFGISPGMQSVLEEDDQRQRSDRILTRRKQKDDNKVKGTIDYVGDIAEIKK